MHVALLRGVNVGGRNRLPMKALQQHLGVLGATRVRTYLQSGNAVFAPPAPGAAAMADALADAIEAGHGFRPTVVVLAAEELRRVAEANAFPHAEATPTTLHLFVPTGELHDPDLAALERARAPDEAYEVRNGVLYLHAPAGLGRSKLAQRVERALHVDVTARNWRTVQALLALAEEESAS